MQISQAHLHLNPCHAHPIPFLELLRTSVGTVIVGLVKCVGVRGYGNEALLLLDIGCLVLHVRKSPSAVRDRSLLEFAGVDRAEMLGEGKRT